MGFLIQDPDSITPLWIDDYSIQVDYGAQDQTVYLIYDGRYLGAFKVLDI